MKKTVEVKEVMGNYNRACKNRPDDFCAGLCTPEAAVAYLNHELRGMCRMIDFILHSTGNYKGFSYVDRDGRICGLDHPDFNEYRRAYVGF